MTLGVRDLKSITLPTAWDGNELARLRLRDGTNWESIVRDIEAGLNIVNASLLDGYLGNLVSLTTDEAVEYRSGGTSGFDDDTEQTQPDRQFAETTGHMLPLKARDRGMGWTAKVLKNIRRKQIDADISSMLDDAVNAFEKAVWTRFFSIAEDTGRSVGLGASGVSVPFADGGAGTIDYIPPPRNDRMVNAFSVSHNHYLVLNGLTQANLETAITHLWEHGVDGPYDLIVSGLDVGSFQNLTNFPGYVPAINALVQYGSAANLAVVDNEVYAGAIITQKGTVRIYANGRIPTGYWAVTKLYGQNDQRNALKIRYDEVTGFGVKLVVNDVTLYPFQAAIAQFEFGVGVGEDRVAAVLVEDDSTGTYTTPTIT